MTELLFPIVFLFLGIAIGSNLTKWSYAKERAEQEKEDSRSAEIAALKKEIAEIKDIHKGRG